MSQFISPNQFVNYAGTWTATNTSNTYHLRRTAANATWVTHIPVNLPSNSQSYKGSKLVSVDLWFEITTEAMDACSAVLYKATMGADGATVQTDSVVTTTYDSGHDDAAERVDVDQHKMTLTLTTPEWMDDDVIYYIEFSGDGGANGVFDWHGARANFTLRI